MSHVTGVSTMLSATYASSIKDTTQQTVNSRHAATQDRNAANVVRQAMANAQASAAIPESANARMKGHLHITV